MVGTGGPLGDDGVSVRLAVVLSFSGKGGVERMMLNLLPGLLAQSALPLAIDLVPIRTDSLRRDEVPDNVRVVELGVRHSTFATGALARYLREERPDAVLVAKDRAIRGVLKARRQAGFTMPVVGRLGTNLSASLEGSGALRRALRLRPVRRLYPLVDAIIAISQGVAEDTRRITGLPGERVHVVRNPVITPDLSECAAAPVAHPWFADGSTVVLGAGRLTRQKDFPTLIRAFAQLRLKRPARLIVLGDGDSEPLLKLATALGVEGDVDFPGHVGNPHAWIAKASLFALSSRWEGSGNVLTEALACGVPAVSTDCPSGPREQLADGRYGPLVPVGDDAALAAAMLRTLDRPLPAATLREAVREYTVATSARGYLRVLGLLDY